MSKVDQESYLIQGLALGLLHQGVSEIPADKLRFEFALSHALGKFGYAHLFPRVGAATNVDPYYLIHRAGRRRGPLLSSWDTSGRTLRAFLWHDDWSVDESGEMLADWSGVPWAAWVQFATDFLDELEGAGD